MVCLVTGETFLHLKGIAELILKQMGIGKVSFKTWVGREPYFVNKKAAIIETSKDLLGTIGEISPQVLAKFEIKSKVIILDLDIILLSETLIWHIFFGWKVIFLFGFQINQ